LAELRARARVRHKVPRVRLDYHHLDVARVRRLLHYTDTVLFASKVWNGNGVGNRQDE
jgi:hypothetical protein